MSTSGPSGPLVFIMQLRKIPDIFPKKPFENVPHANIRNRFWQGVVIKLISSNYESEYIM